MEALAAAVEGVALAEWLRFSRWGYAAVNALHIVGVALLVGAIVPLDLRLLGLWRSVELAPLYRMLSRIAGMGLLLAIASGVLLFSVRATEYAGGALFRAKMVLVILGAVHALALHCQTAFPGDVSRARRRFAGVVSLLLWPSVLVCGRMLGYV